MNIISLKEATREDMPVIWRMQKEAFAALLEKYQDYDLSPGAESLETVMRKFEQPWTTYYFIVAGGENVGAVRIVNKKDRSRKRISPVFILPEYQNRGYAQAAIQEVERLYGDDHWSLDTILQETGNCHLYEKMGYLPTGEIRKVSDQMDIVFYEK